MIDDIDKQILNIMQDNGRIANAEIARQIGLAPSAVLERIRKLEERGVIRGYTTEIEPSEIGFGLTAFVFVRTSFCGSIGEVLAAIPEVLEVHDIAGEDCYLLKVRAENTKKLGEFFNTKLKNLPEIISTKTTIVLETLKEASVLPIGKGKAKKKAEKRSKK